MNCITTFHSFLSIFNSKLFILVIEVITFKQCCSVGNKNRIQRASSLKLIIKLHHDAQFKKSPTRRFAKGLNDKILKLFPSCNKTFLIIFDVLKFSRSHLASLGSTNLENLLFFVVDNPRNQNRK